MRAVRATSVVAVLAVVAVVFVAVPAAQAAAGITLTKSAPGEVLAGEPVTYTLVVANPASNPDAAPEYNIGFRDQLPAGMTYVAGSTTPTYAGEPASAVDAGTGATTLTWTNVADVAVGGSLTLTFQAIPDPAVFPVGSVVTNQASAAASDDPFISPRFDSDGVLVPGTATETADATPTVTTITALQITKSEPSPEGELLRGVHDHTTVYTLTLRTASGGGFGPVTVVDYLPAQLEFLGCGGVDNTGSPEYLGAPLLSATPTPPNCLDPVSVTTVQDPPPNGSTTYPPGVYTRVEWTLPSLAAGSTTTLNYAAGIPLNANALWPAGTEPAGLGQIANLNNNTGPSTRETTTEQSATNIVRASGLYDGPVVDGGDPEQSSDDTATVSIEDLRIRKSVDPTVFQEGQIATYTVTVDTSEYVSASGIVLHDVIPDGMCPLGADGTNYSNDANPLCAGQGAGATPPIDTAIEAADGSYDVVFTPLTLPTNGTTTATYSVRMLPTYPGTGSPTAVGDEFTNHVDATGQTTPRPFTPESGTQTVNDESEATVTAGGGTMDKLVAPRSAAGATCPTSLSEYSEAADLPVGEVQYLEGDLVCYALRADFSSFTQSRDVVVTDFLPPEMEYVDGTATDGNAGALLPAVWSLQSSAHTLQFLVGTDVGGDRFVAPGATFAVVFQARVVASAPTFDPLVVPNLMKVTGVSTDGTPIAFRDEEDVQISPAAPLGVVKGVAQVDDPATGPNGVGSNVDGSEVRLGSVATFRIDVTHLGTAGGPDGYPVGGLDVWDVLPVGLTCADVTNVRAEAPAPAPQVACTDPGDGGPTFAGSDDLSLLRLTYGSADDADITGSQLAAGQTVSFLYDTTIPAPARVGTRYVDTAYVHSYAAVTNVANAPTTIYPKDNIDPSVPIEDQLAPAASDPSNVVVPSVAVDKTLTTSIDEPNNNAENQATIGEIVTYTYGATVPAGSSVYSGRMVDALPTGLVQVGNATLQFQPDAASPTTAAVPAGVAVDPSTGTVTFPSTYTNSTGTDQRFSVVLTARVTTAAMSTTQNAVDVTNTATFTSLEVPGGSALPTASASATVNVRQPHPTLTKTNDQPAPVPGGTLVTYTLTAANANSDGSATNRPPAHDVYVVDCIPAGMTFDSYGSDPGRAPEPGGADNGCATGTTALVWELDTVEAATPVVRTYTAFLPVGAISGTSYTNVATVSGSTLDDGKTSPTAPDNPDERSAAISTTSTVTIIGAEAVKTVTPGEATIGQDVTWTVSFIAPGNTAFYDASMIDVMPPGAGTPELLGITCQVLSTPATACPLEPTALPSVDNPDGSTSFGYTYGDLASSPFDRQVTFRFRTPLTDIGSNVAGAQVVNTAHAAWNETPDGPNDNPPDAGAPFDTRGADATAAVTVLEPSITTTKAVDDPTPGPADLFHYTITATNASTPTTSDAYNVVVQDVVPLGVVVDPASISQGGTITGRNPIRGGGTITWSPANPDGPIPPGGSVALTYSATLAPSNNLTPTPLVNTATVTGYDSLATGGRHYSGGAATASVTPQFPFLTTTKAAVDPAPAYIGEPFTWQITTQNTGGAPAYGVDVADAVPPGWSYVAGSAVVTTPAGSTPTEPDVQAGGDALVWTDLGTLQPGESIVVTIDLVPDQDVTDDPGVGSSVAQVNTAVAQGEDATGATTNGVGPYYGPAVTAQTRIDSADLQIVKTHTDPVVAGSDATWQLVVTNLGDDVAVGPFTVTDTVPSGLTLVSATGAGWTCTGLTTVTCVRSNAADTLASGVAFPAIVLVTSVPADTASGTQFTNAATVQDRTYDPVTPNNSTTDTATVTSSADLAIAKTHAGPAIAGQSLTWTLGVVNNGPSDSQPDITVTDTLPTGATPVSATGTDWSCSIAGQAVTCVRDTVLASGGVAPDITVVANIGADVTGTLSNTAVVDGTTPDPNPANNTSTDPVTVETNADLAIEKSHLGTFVAGAPGTYRFDVVNDGPSDAAAPVTITDTLPAGVTYTGFADVTGTWTCSAAGQDLTCTLTGGLAVGDSVAVTVSVDLDPGLGIGTLTNEATVSSPTTDPNLDNNTDDDLAAFDAQADLVIDKSHTGDATAGEQLVWNLQVRNAGPSDSPGPIVVSDALPAGTSYVSATGTGWTCTTVARLVRCTSNATLAAGDDEPPITLTVLVAPDAGPSTIVNRASVNGPLTDPVLSNNTDADPVVVVDQANISVTKAVVGSANVTAGTNVDYTITVANDGPSDADSVVMRDVLPAGMAPVSATGPGWSCVVAGSTVVCTRPVLAGPSTPGVPTTSPITVTAHVGTGVPAGSALTNTATVATSTAGDDPADNTDDATVFVDASADLALAKTHDTSKDPVAAGHDATFTLQVRNLGPSDAQDVTVTDTLPAGLTYVSSSGPWTCTSPDQVVVTCTLDAGKVVANTLAPALNLTVHVDQAAAAGSYVNTGVVSSSTPDPVTPNNTATDALPVVDVADLSVTKVHVGAAHIGDDLHYTVEVTNAGPSQALDVSLVDPQPTGATFVSGTGTDWTCTVGLLGRLTCELGTPLAAGATAPPIDVVATVGPKAYPVLLNTVTVSTSTTESDTTNNSASDRALVPALADLSIDKSHDSPFVVGADSVWHLAVTNNGPTRDPGPITVTDRLPASVSYVRAVALGGIDGSCSAAGQLVTCVSRSPLAVGATLTFDLVVVPQADAYPSIVNTAAVTSPAEDTNPRNNVDVDPVDVLPTSRLSIVKDVVSTQDQNATYRIVVTNQGPNVTTAPVIVTDTPPEGETLTGVDAAAPWSCSLSNNLATCTYPDPIAVGASAPPITVEATITGGDGTYVNVATASGGVPPGSCPDCAPVTDDASVVLSAGELSATGSDPTPWALMALALLVVGGGLLAVRRWGVVGPHGRAARRR